MIDVAQGLGAIMRPVIVSVLVGVWIWEPLRLAFKEMGRRQTLIWLACVPLFAAFCWLVLG